MKVTTFDGITGFPKSVFILHNSFLSLLFSLITFISLYSRSLIHSCASSILLSFHLLSPLSLLLFLISVLRVTLMSSTVFSGLVNNLMIIV